jgi:multicomponent Na+:H+ antiporter subunit A
MPLTGLFSCVIVLALAGLGLWLLRPHRSHWYAWLAALPPTAVALWLLWLAPTIVQGEQLAETFEWAPDLGLALSLRLDGLSLLFALIVTGIGACIAYYTNYYFEGDEQQGYFYLLLFLFMASMLGLVLANDLLLLYIFWEGTSITSYLLIAFKSSYKGAVEGARRALIVTTAGGLAMLAGMLLLGQAAGTYRLDELVARRDLLSLPTVPWALGLLMLGAFTKSAQFPFHFWLPGAMAAPTPASAYLHSATMVKAGVYLLARLQPPFGGSPLWFWPLFAVGGITMVLGAVSAIRYRDMKAVLAYTTISALGTMTMLLAFNVGAAAMAACATILAHALYKAPLFLMAGIVDHAMGTRDLRRLAGLWRPLPWTAAVAVVAGVSMAGVPPTWGFLSKELLLEEFYHLWTHDAPQLGGIGLAAGLVMAVFTGAAIFTLIWEAVLRRRADEVDPAHLHHKPAFAFVAPALLLALAGGLTPLWLDPFQALLAAAAAAITGAAVEVSLKLWHGWTPVFVASLAVLAVALLMVFMRGLARRLLEAAPQQLNGTAIYDALIDAIYGFAYRLTKLIQGGSMAPQAAVTLLAAATVVLFAWLQVDFLRLPLLEAGEVLPIDVLIKLVAIVAAVATVRARSRLSAIISLGVVGIAVTLFFVFFSAPDLALTQLLIEVLTVILLVLVFFRVKPDPKLAPASGRQILRWAIAIGMGMFGAGIVLANHVYQVGESISPYFLANALPIGQGGNVVNVILVDIRGYDTLGEITVLAIAALGGYAVLRSPHLHALRRKLAQRLPQVLGNGGDAEQQELPQKSPQEPQTLGVGND